MTRPLFTDAAQDDLRQIAAESIRLFGAKQSRLYIRELRKAAAALAHHRSIGRRFDDKLPNHRRFLVGVHYLIFRVRDDGRLLIVRILHSRMDLSSHL